MNFYMLLPREIRNYKFKKLLVKKPMPPNEILAYATEKVYTENIE